MGTAVRQRGPLDLLLVFKHATLLNINLGELIPRMEEGYFAEWIRESFCQW